MTNAVETRQTDAASAAPSPDSELRPRGRTVVSQRALTRVVAAVVGESLGVDVGRIRVDLSDDHGALAVTVRSPIPVPSLEMLRNSPRSLERTGGSVMERSSRVHSDIRDRVTALTGSILGAVAVHLTAGGLEQPARVT